MERWQERVIGERDGLSERIVKLNDFMDSREFDRLESRDKVLLTMQSKWMRYYLDALNDRIALFRFSKSL